MKISLIMPIYNAEKRLEKALDSILRQSYQNLELILINDGSTDQSLEICQTYANKHQEVRLISIENSGPGAARNVGLDQVTGEYISFVDADDYLEPNFLERLVEITADYPFDVVSSNYYQVAGERAVAKNNYHTGTIAREGSIEERKRYDRFKTSSSFGYVWGKLYKTAFIKEHNLRFSEERKVFLEDTLFNLKGMAHQPTYYVLNEPLYNYNVYEGSVSNKKEEITDRALQLLENYVSFLDAEDVYKENLDLLLPLANRVIAWSLFKTMDHDYHLRNILAKVRCFSNDQTVQRVVKDKGALKELRKIDSRLQVLFYSLITLAMRFKFDRTFALFFYVNNPLFKMYLKRTSKA